MTHHGPVHILVLSLFLGAVPAEPTPRVVRVEPVSDNWYALRVADALSRGFYDLGFEVAGAGLPADAELVVRAEDPSGRSKSAPWLVQHGKAEFRYEGRADAIDQRAADVAAALASSWLNKTIKARPAASRPFVIHRALAKAQRRLRDKKYRSAALSYSRVMDLAKRRPVPEAWDGWVVADRAARGGDNRRSLASAAAERVQVALKNGQDNEARSALKTLLKNRPLPAQPFVLVAAQSKAPVVAKSQAWFTWSTPRNRIRYDANTGTTRVDPPQDGLLKSVWAPGEEELHDLWFTRGALSRGAPSKRPLWSTKLPGKASERLLVASGGFVGVAHPGLFWLDLRTGQPAQSSAEAEVLALGSAGALAWVPPRKRGAAWQLGLLRPGKKTPAWRVTRRRPKQAALSRERVVVLDSEGVSILRVDNGKRLAGPWAVPEDARLLSAFGRHAVVSLGGGKARIYDILSREEMATIVAPPSLAFAYTYGAGVALICRSGDVLFYDRDGHLLDRGLAPGPVLGVSRGPAQAAGPEIHTEVGLYAFSEVPLQPGLSRDVDAWLAWSQLELRAKNWVLAESLATKIARSGMGRLAEAESVRAKALAAQGRAAEATQAKARATRAKNPALSLPPFGSSSTITASAGCTSPAAF